MHPLIRRTMCLVTIVYTAAAIPALCPAADADQDALVALLRYREGALRSIEAVYEVRPRKSVPAAERLVRELSRLRGITDTAQFVASDAYIRQNGLRHRWWRKGIKERFETTFIFKPDSLVQTYDGTTVRIVYSDKRSAGIYSTDTGNWDSPVRKNLYGLVYARGKSRYSELLAAAGEVSVNREGPASSPQISVTFGQPDASFPEKLTLRFDQQGRLLERRTSLPPLGKGPKLDVLLVERYSDYREHKNLDGNESIWFPYHIVIENCLGTLPDGRLVPTLVDDVRVSEMKFNQDLADELFTQEIPTEAEVYDGLVTRTYLPPGVRPLSVFSPGATRAWQLVALSCLASLVVLMAGLMARRILARRGIVQVRK
jgi:hypothetical protein